MPAGRAQTEASVIGTGVRLPACSRGLASTSGLLGEGYREWVIQEWAIRSRLSGVGY